MHAFRTGEVLRAQAACGGLAPLRRLYTYVRCGCSELSAERSRHRGGVKELCPVGQGVLVFFKWES